MEIGPDGALYFLDWHNPLIGHMQHSIRDPSRDRSHGRVYRLVCRDRPLSQPPKIAGQSLDDLFDLLRQPEDRVRYRVRIELGGRDSDQVTAAARNWIKRLDPTDPDHEHHLLEALWIHQSHNVVNRELLERLLESPDFHARAAATRVLCEWRDRVPQALELVRSRALDDQPRVRLEAVRACSFFQTAEAAEVALLALRRPQDRFLAYALSETVRELEPFWKPLLIAGRPFAVEHPPAVQYVLGRLGTSELLELEPSRAVCLQLLSREGVPHPRRHAALMQLAKLNGTDMVRETLATLERLDTGDAAQASPVLADLSHLLSEHDASELSAHRQDLARLAVASKHALTRHLALVTLVKIDGSLNPVWEAAADSLSRLRDVVETIPLIPEAQPRAAAHTRLKSLLHKLPAPLAAQARDIDRDPNSEEPALEFRKAVIHAITYTGVERPETIRLLSGLVSKPRLRAAVIAALGRMPLSDWPPAEVEAMVKRVIDQLKDLPVDERTSEAAREELALGNRLVSLLPPEQAATAREALDELGVRVIVLRPIPQQLRYDRTRIFVEAGRPVEIVFDNVDIMPHNLVITRPGALARVGLAAEALVGQPDAFARDFVPDTDDVLLATRLLQPSQSDRIAFVAPREVGEYPFVCTFPGHWRRMHGTIHVVERLDRVPFEMLAPRTDSQLPVRPLVRAWTIEDLQDELTKLEAGRSFARGKSLFEAASCVQCHQLRGDGGRAGPDLAAVQQKLASKQWQAVDLLRELIDPSARIDPKYVTQIIQDTAGRVHTGIVVSRDERTVQLLANPMDRGEPITIPVAEIEQEFPSKVSLMPPGLLNTLSQDEILDLLAYVIAGGDPESPVFGSE
jgi:putative heme-binding domain-containing protein